jgi:hypothetical protein
MKRIRSFTIKFQIVDDVLQTALGRDDNFETATEEMKILLAYQLYLMCYDYERQTAFQKDGCVIAQVKVEEEEEGYI